MGTRKIIHMDLDAFFCAVEELRDPALKGKPFAVGGSPDGRGVVSSCSYAARQFGVRSAMPMGKAMRLCPELVVVRSGYGNYTAYSKRVMAVLKDISPLVEQISIDEAFLDVTDIQQPGLRIAEDLQKRINGDIQLPCSLGIATNKLVAKMANNYAKAIHKGAGPPNAILEVLPGKEAEFIGKLPTRELWGVGPKTAEKLAKMGIRKIGQLAEMPEEMLIKHFGKMGRGLARHAKGIDERPVVVEHGVKSISQEMTFRRDTADVVVLKRKLCDLTEQVGYRLRRKGLCASTVRLKLRWHDFSTLTRQITLDNPTDQDGIICEAVTELFDKIMIAGKPVRLVGVGVSSLKERIYQPSLWDTPNDKERKLLGAVDELRERYGKNVIRRGRSIKSSGEK